ncbi:MAG: hypothetical protein ABEJ92_05940 [Halobacteriales archaeon]
MAEPAGDGRSGHRAVAVNVGANTNAPGFRGPRYPDRSFEFVPIPEPAPTVEPVPTYGDLPLSFDVPADVRDTPVHLDPEFAEYGPGERYTYGDPYGVKARPLLDLAAGDRVYFYATLARLDEEPGGGGPAGPPWRGDGWGAYLVGRFVLDRDPVAGETDARKPAAERAIFANNAHVKRDPFDAAVLLHGDPSASGLFGTAVPLSAPGDGAVPNRVVTDLSADSGRGPWWRRPLRFDADAAGRLAALASAGPEDDPLFAAGEPG